MWRRLAVIMAALAFFLSGWLMGVFSRPEAATVVLAIAFAGIAFSAVFYFGALLTEGSLQKYLIQDETVIKGDSVDMVTRTKSSGDRETDRWVGTYVFAHNLFGMSVIPLLILGYFFFFG